MFGSKTEQCARACRIIQQALRFPFVDVTVWGFSACEKGSITLTRYDSKREVVITKRDRRSGGMTPLHIAIRLAARELKRGNEAKQLLVITDGFPTYTRGDGKKLSTEQLLMFTREEVRKARSLGIHVTGVMVGQKNDGRPVWSEQGGEVVDGTYYDLKAKDMAFVFGAQRNWRRMRPERIGQGLVELVATSFIDFLRQR